MEKEKESSYWVWLRAPLHSTYMDIVRSGEEGWMRVNPVFPCFSELPGHMRNLSHFFLGFT